MHKPPSKLTAEARKLWRDITSQFVIDDAPGLALVQIACESLDSLRAAEAAVRKDGMMIRDRYGQPKAHPALATIRDSRAAMLRALRQLRLEPESQQDRRRFGGRV